MKKIIPVIFLLSACSKSVITTPAIVPPTTVTNNNTPIQFYKGFNFNLTDSNFRKKNPYFESDISMMFSTMKNLGSNTVILDWYVNFNNDGTLVPSTSSTWYLSPDNLSYFIGKAKTQGLFVILKPHVTLTVATDNRNIWNTDSTKFNSKFISQWSNYLTTLIYQLGATSFDGLCIGTEMNMVDCGRRDEWLQLINNVRNVYKGQITYDALFNRYDNVPDVKEVVFWDQLDYISCSLYVPVSKNDSATLDQIKYGWHNNKDYEGNQLGDVGDVIDYLSNISKQYNKKIYAMESGYQSMSGALFNVNDESTLGKSQNFDLQAKGFSAYLQNVDNSLFSGVSIWGYHINTIMDKNNNSILYYYNFGTYQKPSSDTIRKYFAKY
jgi:hypothetical protein